MALQKSSSKRRKTPKKEAAPSREEARQVAIRVFGVGGGGSAIVQGLAQSSPKVSCCAIDARQGRKKTGKRVSFVALSPSFIESIRESGEKTSKDRGQGEREKLQKLLQGNDFCVFVASLGGNTARSVLPFLIRQARRQGVLTLGIFMMPFAFEGETKREIAKHTLSLVRPFLHASCVLSNERVLQVMDSQIPLTQALGVVNKNVQESLTRLFETIFVPGIVNIDFADLRTTLRGYGKFGYLQSFNFHKDAQPQQIFESAMKESLHLYTPERGQSMLLHIKGPKDIPLQEVHEISNTMQKFLHPTARIIFGISSHKDKGNDKNITFLVSGCKFQFADEQSGQKKSSKKSPKRKKKAIQKRKAILAEPIKKEQKNVVPKKKKLPKASLKKKVVVAKKHLSARPHKSVVGQEKKEKVRKNALQVKQDLEQREKEIIEKEKAWDIPAFLRKPQM